MAAKKGADMIETDARIRGISLLKERVEENRIPTLEETLHLAYFRGMCINIDLKEGIKNAEEIAKLVVGMGMRGRCVYATKISFLVESLDWQRWYFLNGLPKIQNSLLLKLLLNSHLNVRNDL